MLALEIVYKTRSLIYLFSYRWPGTKSWKSDFTISNYGILLRDGKVEVPWSLTQGRNTSFICLSFFLYQLNKKAKPGWLSLLCPGLLSLRILPPFSTSCNILRFKLKVFTNASGSHRGFDETVDNNGTPYTRWFTFTATVQCRSG